MTAANEHRGTYCVVDCLEDFFQILRWSVVVVTVSVAIVEQRKLLLRFYRRVNHVGWPPESKMTNVEWRPLKLHAKTEQNCTRNVIQKLEHSTKWKHEYWIRIFSFILIFYPRGEFVSHQGRSWPRSAQRSSQSAFSTSCTPVPMMLRTLRTIFSAITQNVSLPANSHSSVNADGQT